MFSLISRRCGYSLRCGVPSKLNWRAIQAHQFSKLVSTKDLDLHPITQGDVNISVTSIEDDSICINNIYIRQSVLMFPKSFYLWSAREVGDISLASLSLVPILFPTLEMLIIGCGKTTLDMIPKEDLMEDFRQRGIVLEFMSSHHAATTFNILNEEDRHIGAAILLSSPPPVIDEADLKLLAEFRGSR